MRMRIAKKKKKKIKGQRKSDVKVENSGELKR